MFGPTPCGTCTTPLQAFGARAARAKERTQMSSLQGLGREFRVESDAAEGMGRRSRRRRFRGWPGGAEPPWDL
eukprot:14412104-Alexandrium_andersonii.AAC.1